MKKIFLILILTLSLFVSVHPSFAVDDTIVAVVNDDIVTLKDVREYLSAMYFQLTASGQSKEEIKKAMSEIEKKSLAQLIDDKLILTEATKKNIFARDKVVNKKLDEVRNKYPTEQEFVKSLTAEGMTVTDLKKYLGDQMRTKYLIDIEVRQKIFVNPQEVTKYYNQNIKEFYKPEQMDLLSIFVPFGQDRKIAENKIVNAQEELKNGKAFDDVAKTYSQLPHLGLVTKDNLLPEIANMIVGLKEGETSKPIETDKGIFLLKLKKINPPEQVGLNEVKDKIYATLFNQKFHKRLLEWLEKLRKNAYIEIKG